MRLHTNLGTKGQRDKGTLCLCAFVPLCLFMAGCHANSQTGIDIQQVDTQLVSSLNDIQVRNAIIRQHALFAWHFMENDAELNELGQRDLAELAKHFAEHPGHLAMPQKDTPADLYEARVNLVVERLRKAGIDTERIKIGQDMPGGSGMASVNILSILEHESHAQPIEMTTGATGRRP